MKKARKAQAKQGSTIDAAEVQQFDDLKEQWWDTTGPTGMLHRLNPLRLDYIRRMAREHFGLPDGLRALKGLSVADIGCGGGIVAEPLARMGGKVTGVDAGKENIRIAKEHAKAHRLDIDYRATTAEALAATGKQFDIVTALEIVEHVADVDLFMRALCKIVKPGGLLVMSTLNRTPKSWLLGIALAEYVLRMIPAGSHDWKKFLKPSELARQMQKNGLDVTDLRGILYNPLSREFSLSAADLDVNYVMTATKAR